MSPFVKFFSDQVTNYQQYLGGVKSKMIDSVWCKSEKFQKFSLNAFQTEFKGFINWKPNDRTIFKSWSDVREVESL